MKNIFHIFFIIIFFFIPIHTADHGEWFITEQTYHNQRKLHIAQEYWNKNILEKVNHDHSLIKNILETRSLPENYSEKNSTLLEQSIQTRNFDLFNQLLHELDNLGVSIIEYEEKLPVPLLYGNAYPCKENILISPTALEKLQDYIRDCSFSGIISIHTPADIYTLASANISHHAVPFAVHSISKIFTELLLLFLIEENIISQKMLNKPLCIDKKVKKLLPTTIKKQLQKVTMKDIMEHRGGFGDYTVNYFEKLAQQAKNNESIKLIEKLEDFLPYAEETIFTIGNGESHYSNLGMVLLGLSIEHWYNKNKHNQNNFSFEQILKKYIIEPAGMKIFSSQRPEDGCYNESGLCSQYICASPAGGHWTTAHDLHQFGLWLKEKYTKNSRFKELLSSLYFYDSTTEELHHSGGIGQPGIGEASARFALFLKQDISIVILSNKPQQAFTMYQTIYHNIFANRA